MKREQKNKICSRLIEKLITLRSMYGVLPKSIKNFKSNIASKTNNDICKNSKTSNLQFHKHVNTILKFRYIRISY